MSVRTLSETRRSAVTETVLFVDSDILVRTAVAEYLRECGYHVIEALNAEEALKILRASAKVDALFSEIGLSGEVDGFALAQAVRQEFPEIEVILASGPSLIAKKSGELCEENGNTLAKPYHPEQLAHKLKSIFAQRKRKD